MAKHCTNCGTELRDGVSFCTECGTKITQISAAPKEAPQTQKAPEAPVSEPRPAPQMRPQTPYAQQESMRQQPQQSQYRPQYQPQPSHGAPAETVPGDSSKYQPITTGGFIGIMLLMAIPFIGIILTVIWACGGCRKVNKRNLARASLIMMAIALVLSLILGFALKSLFNSVIDGIKNGAEENIGFDLWNMTGDNNTEAGTSDDGALGELEKLLEGLGGLESSEDMEGLEELLKDLETMEE